MRVKSLSRVQLFATPWTVAYNAPPSMGFSMQEYWSGVPFLSPEDLLDALQADSLPAESPGKPQYLNILVKIPTWENQGTLLCC